MCNGNRIACAFDTAAVGAPLLRFTLPAARAYRISVAWHGRAPAAAPAERSYRVGDALELPAGVGPRQVDDPQNALADGHVAALGFHNVFANIHDGDATWSMPISFEVKAEAPLFAAIPGMPADAWGEQVGFLAPVLKQLRPLRSSRAVMRSRDHSTARSPSPIICWAVGQIRTGAQASTTPECALREGR